jgi:RNA polymerase sigma-70 factor, ECF subfamily
MLYSFDQHQLKDQPRPTASEVTDEVLMERIQAGDEQSLAALHRRHQPLIRTIIGRMINNDSDVDDLEQECLLEVWRHAENYRVEKGHALGWIVTLVRRRTIDRIRRKTAYGRAQDRFRDESSTVAERTHTGADEEAAQSDRAEVVSRLIANLPPAQQDAVRLAFYRGMTQRQIAAHTGIPLGTIKTRLELALRKLRSSVLAFGELHDEMQAA